MFGGGQASIPVNSSAPNEMELQRKQMEELEATQNLIKQMQEQDKLEESKMTTNQKPT